MDKVSAGFDQLTRFWFESAPARGVVLRLDEQLGHALRHHDYPPCVVALLKQLAGAALILGSNLKQPAKVILQAQGSGDVTLLCVEATESLGFRLYASIREGAVFAVEAIDLASLVAPAGDGRFVLTIAPEEGQMYQGIVELRPGPVAEMLEDYLANSQQTDTRLWLREDGDALEALLLERLPDSAQQASTSSWERVVAQAEAIFSEHFMPFPYRAWLTDSFPGHDVKMQTARAVQFACSCSEERVLNALKLVGMDELQPLIEQQGHIDTRCEFCGRRYIVSEGQLTALFAAKDAAHPPGPRTLQ
jgi:molecular chaperone Hsp33